MADRIKGITIEIGGDTTKLSQALKSTNAEIKSTQSALKDVERLLKLDPKNTELLRQKQVLLKQAIEGTSEKLKTLHEAEKQLKNSGVDKNSEQFMALRREIADTEAQNKKFKDEVKNASKALDDNSASAEKNSKALDGLKSAAAAAGKAMAAVGAAAAAGVTALTKSAVEGYADYEQLVGGVETLFGENADAVVKNAENAYKTAGMSANAYMETVTSFSASLIQSMGGDTEAAADEADKAIRDMSDNANKMGTDMASITNAYQGFAKQNYTMLDNLKLGYGGTKTEMERLIKDAEKLDKTFVATRDENGELAMSYADIVDAIHIVQTDLGITGTTAEEAAETISGSTASMKAAWQNFTAGLANPDADIGALIEQMVEAGTTALNNLMPAITQALVGIAAAIETLAPIIAERLPEIIGAILPALITAVMALIQALANSLPQILQVIINMLPDLLDTVVNAILAMLDTIVDVGLDLILALADGLIKALPELIPAVVGAILKIVETLTQPENLAMLIEAAIQLILALAVGLAKALPQLVDAAIQITKNLIGVFKAIDWSGIWDGIVDAAKKVWEGIKQVFAKVGDFFGDTFKKAWEKVTKVFSVAGSIFVDIKDGIVTAFKKIVNGLIGGINKVISKPFEAINTALKKIKEINILGAEPFKNLATISIPQIPLLAKGGIVSSGSAIVGEAGPELLTMQGGRAIVQPLTTNNTTNSVSAPVNINVYGAAGQDVNELADAISRRIQLHVDARMGAF